MNCFKELSPSSYEPIGNIRDDKQDCDRDGHRWSAVWGSGGVLGVRNTRLLPAQVAALQKALSNCKIEWDDPAKSTTQATVPIPPTWNNRTMAEWVLARGGKLWIGDRKDIAKVEDLPATINSILVVSFKGTHFGDADAKVMSGWPHKVGFSFENTSLTDAGLRDLAKVQRYGSLGLRGSPITGEGFDAFKSQGIGNVTVGFCQLSPVGWRHLAQIGTTIKWTLGYSTLTDDALLSILEVHPEIESMDLTATGVTDSIVEEIAKLPKLNWLFLEVTKISDSGLVHLEQCKTLTAVHLKTTKVTSSGVAALQKALPNCKIEWDDPAKASTPQPAASGTR